MHSDARDQDHGKLSFGEHFARWLSVAICLFFSFGAVLVYRAYGFAGGKVWLGFSAVIIGFGSYAIHSFRPKK
jgi:hypothetical protein